MAARTLASFDVDGDSLQRAADEARREGTRPSLLALSELVAEIERLRARKKAMIEAHEFEDAAKVRDAERQLTSEAREKERRLRETLDRLRSCLGLTDR